MAAGLTVADAGGAGFGAGWRHARVQLRAHPAQWWLIGVLPVAMLILLGWMFQAGAIRSLPIAVVDLDNSTDSRELVRTLRASPGVDMTASPANLEQAWSLVRSLQAYAVVLVPSTYSRDTWHDRAGTVFVFYNAAYLTAGQSAARDIGDAITAYNLRLVRERVALRDGPASIHGLPVSVQASVLFNAARSFQQFLMSLLIPAVLSLVLALAVAGTLGRELASGEAARWMHGSTAQAAAALVGRLLPYLLVFGVWAMLGELYLALAQGHGPLGSVPLLALGQCLLYLASAAFALLFIGVTGDGAKALSAVGLSLGTALAFSGATFTVVDAPLFTRVWNLLLPLTAFSKLHAQQFDIGAPWQASLAPLLTLAALAAAPAVIGLLSYRRRVLQAAAPPAPGDARDAGAAHA